MQVAALLSDHLTMNLTLDGDHFYMDLVFYNRLLRCFVLVDLEMGKPGATAKS